MSRQITFEPDIDVYFEVEAYFDGDDYLERIEIIEWVDGVGRVVTDRFRTEQPFLFGVLEKTAVEKARESEPSTEPNFDDAG